MNLNEALLKATQECKYDNEEEGGFLLVSKDRSEYKFIKVRNDNTGKPIASILYDADRVDMGNVIKEIVSGWSVFASFHTHPGSSTTPSSIDLKKLFTSCGVNFIYSPLAGLLSSYEFSEGNPNGKPEAYPAYEAVGMDEHENTITQGLEGYRWLRRDVRVDTGTNEGH